MWRRRQLLQALAAGELADAPPQVLQSIIMHEGAQFLNECWLQGLLEV